MRRLRQDGARDLLTPTHAVAFHGRQSRHFILQLQLATLEFRQSEIAYGWMLKRIGKLVLEHPMPLNKFGKICRCGHGILRGSDLPPDCDLLGLAIRP
jgi:hypothetical protein